MPLIPGRFNSPWNPFDRPSWAPPRPASQPKGYGLTPADVSGDPYAGSDGSVADIVNSAAVTAANSLLPGNAAGIPASFTGVANVPGTVFAGAPGTPVVFRSDGQGNPALRNDGRTIPGSAPGTVLANGLIVAGTPLPGALRSNGQMTPGLDDAVRDREYGWNAQSETLFRRYRQALKVIGHIRQRKPPDPASMPASGIRINPNGSLLITPQLPSGVYPVLTYRVPAGYYGFINYASNEYTGGGFAEAAGALVWAIKIQGWYYPNYGTIPFSLGSRLSGLWNIAGGLPLLSNQNVVFSVIYNTVPGVASGGYVICTLQGWIAPVGEQSRQEAGHGGQ